MGSVGVKAVRFQADLEYEANVYSSGEEEEPIGMDVVEDGHRVEEPSSDDVLNLFAHRPLTVPSTFAPRGREILLSDRSHLNRRISKSITTALGQ